MAKSWGCAPWIITGEEPTEVVRQKWLALGYLYDQQMVLKMNSIFAGNANE